MRKWKILLGAVVLLVVAAAVLAKDQLSRNIILLKSGRIIPFDRVWESGADLFYENDQEIHFVSLADIRSIEKQSLSTWWQPTATRITNFAGTCVNALNPLIKSSVELAQPPSARLWLLLGSVSSPAAFVLALRWARRRSRQDISARVAPAPAPSCPQRPNRSDVVRFFLGLYRQQLGSGPEAPAEFVQLPSSSAGPSQIYELRVHHGGEWVKRRMTLGPLGEDSGSKSKCYYVIFDQHLVVKIPPKPITKFDDYIASIKKERSIVERLRPKECIVPKVSVILSQIHPLPSPSGGLPDQLEEKYVAWLRKTPAHQDYLKINGTFVFFMDLSRYYFLSHIIDSLHDLAEPIRSEITATAEFIPYPVKFKERYGEENESVGFEIRDLYHRCEAEVREVLKNRGKSAAVTPYLIQVWFLNFLETKNISEPRAVGSPPQVVDDVAAAFTRLFEKHNGTVEAYLSAIRAFTARLCLQQNRQIISGILSNLLDLLAGLNEKKVAMRDLKPDNLLVAGDPQNYPAFLRSAGEYELGFIDVETAVCLDPSDRSSIKQPLLGGTPYYATPSHLFPNAALRACLSDPAWVLHFQDWHAVLVMIYKAVTGDLLFDRTAKLFGEVKGRMVSAIRQNAPLEPLMEDVSRKFWRSAAREFRGKLKGRESALKSVEVDIPKTAKGLFVEVLRRDAAAISGSVRRLVAAQTYFPSMESRELLLKSSYRRTCQISKSLQAKRGLDLPAADSFKATDRFLQHLCTLKALIERKTQLIALLEGEAVPRLNAHEILLLMFNSVLKAMCREHWYRFAEETSDPKLSPDDDLSLATTI